MTVASTGGICRKAFARPVEAPGLEGEVQFARSHFPARSKSVAVAKILAQPDNPPYSVSSHGDPEAPAGGKNCLRCSTNWYCQLR